MIEMTQKLRLQLAIGDIVSAVTKAADAPCSSDTHLDAAICRLVKFHEVEFGPLPPLDAPERADVVRLAQEHLALYPHFIP